MSTWVASKLIEAVLTTVKAFGKPDGYIRLVVTRGIGNLGLDPHNCTEPQIIIIVDDISLYPAKALRGRLEIITASTIRNHPGALNARIKSPQLSDNILGKIEAIQAGCLEAIMLNHNGEVAECTPTTSSSSRRGCCARRQFTRVSWKGSRATPSSTLLRREDHG